MDALKVKVLTEMIDSFKKNWKSFPKKCCEGSSRAVMDVFGFPMVKGIFISENGKITNHWWNITPEEEILDITARQFDETLSDIYIVNKDSPEARVHYKEGVHYIEGNEYTYLASLFE